MSSPNAPQIGQYRIVRELARGGMGAVYEGYDPRLDRPVAIKVMLADAKNQQAVARFLREARALANLHHKHIVRVWDIGQLQGSHYMVMDLVQGESLHRRLEREGPLPEREVARIGAAVARALAYAHERGILHRDVKPHNVLLTPDGVPKLTDFGIAKVEHQQETRAAHDPTQMAEVQVAVAPQLTMEGEVLGTPAFMSPEQADGEVSVDFRADVYSLGATLYALLSGRPPFLGENLVNLLTAVLTREPDPLSELRPDIDPKLEAICAQAMAKEPEDRFADATAFAEALERYARSGSAPQRRLSSSGRTRAAPAGRRRGGRAPARAGGGGVPPAAVAAIAVPAVLLVGFFLLRGGRRAPAPEPTATELASATPSPTRSLIGDPSLRTPDPTPSPTTGSASPSPTPTPEPSSPSPSASPRPVATSSPTPTASASPATTLTRKEVRQRLRAIRQLERAKRYAEAWAQLEALKPHAPTNPARARTMARVGYWLRKDPKRILATLDAAVAAHPKNPNLRIGRGLVHMGTRRFGEALRDFEVARERKPGYEALGILTLQAAVGLRDIPRILKVLDALVAQFPAGEIGADVPQLGGQRRKTAVQLRVQRADVRIQLERYAEGLEDLEHALKTMRPNHPLRAKAESLRAQALAALPGRKPKQPVAPQRAKRAKAKPHGKLVGGKEGKAFRDDPPRKPLTAVRIRAGAWIDAIQLVFGAGDAQPLRGSASGGGYQIELRPDEYLTKISGRRGTRIVALTLHTNLRRIGPLGAASGGVPFELAAPAGHEICGLRGRAGKFVAALGILVRKR